MRRAWSGLMVVVCAAIAAQGCGGCHRPPPIPLDDEAKSGPLLFPPRTEWVDRVAAPETTSRSGGLRLTSTAIQDGKLTILGTEIPFDFDEDAVTDLAKAPSFTITPALPIKTVWTSRRSVEVHASKSFDPEVDYTLTLPDLVAPSGAKLSGYRAVFRAKPQTTIAGKTVPWIPEKGQPRLVYLRPVEDKDVGPNHELVAIYDQPIPIERAQQLLSATIGADKNERKQGLSLRHPAPGQTFEGEKVDTQAVVLFTMTPPPAPGSEVAIEARGAKDDWGKSARKLTIPALPKLAEIGCFDTGGCKVNGSVVEGPISTGLAIKYSNPISHKDLEGKITVTPKPPNLSFGGWDEELGIHGSWAASTTYTIQTHGLVDRYGYRLPDVNATWRTNPRTASAILREGVVIIDEKAKRDFSVATRNVKRGELLVWPVEESEDALRKALVVSNQNRVPSGDPRVFPFDAASPTAAEGDQSYTRTPLDLGRMLEPGKAYLAQVRVATTAFGAKVADGTASTPLVFFASKDAIGAHVHQVEDKTLVAVYRLGSGEPVSGAEVAIGTSKATTTADGVAVLATPATRGADGHELTVTAGAERTAVPLGSKIATAASEMYPILAAAGLGDRDSGESNPTTGRTAAFVMVDKGIYRPGTVLHAKAFVRTSEEKRLAPLANAKVRLVLVDANGSDAASASLVTSGAGTASHDFEIASGAPTGTWRLRLETEGERSHLHEQTVRVATFETPRFKVDVETPPAPDGRFKAKVLGSYFFGGALQGGRVTWSIRKKAHAIDGGKLGESGLTFVRERAEFDEGDHVDDNRPVTGEGVLGEGGVLDVDAALGPMPEGSAEVTFEADVVDASYRHIAGRKTVIRSKSSRHGGLRLERSFGAAGPLRIELGVVDDAGKTLAGVPVEARVERLEWRRTMTKAESGAVVDRWGTVATPVGRCTVTSDASARACDVVTSQAGEYRVTARVDGQDGGSVSFYAWGGSSGGSDDAVVPGAGKKTPVVTDKRSYRAGETAKVLVQSPFAEAMAILTVERGALVKHEARRIKGPSAVFDVPLTGADAPHVHAVVTLLPIGATDAPYRVGVVRLPVSVDDARLSVEVSSDRKTYDVKEEAEIRILVKKAGAPVKNADVALAVVDEAILRMTAFRTKDPLSAFHTLTARGLSFTAYDSRQLFFRRMEKAHVAGGGGSDDEGSVEARRDFVETLAWLPTLTTDGDGKITTKIKLADNMTEFRMMATAIDAEGSSGVAEDRFVTTRPFLLDPLLPGFATRGDKLEIGAMVHNNTDAPTNAKVTILDQARDVRVEAHGKTRVTVPFVAESSRPIRVSLDVDGKRRDAVEKKLDVALAGMEETPRLWGSFRGTQEVSVEIPEDALFDEGAKLTIRTGAALYPELGQRLAYLRDYPHGCVEQTTSGTLPYLAARDLVAWTGDVGLDDEAMRDRIKAGVKRLATMKTSSGGLAYWPGGKDPHVYGTVYATRALLAAKEIGIEEKELLPGVVEFLKNELEKPSQPPSLRAAIAEILARAGALESGPVDSLFHGRDELDTYGLASLALALDRLPKQGDRIKIVLDELEGSFEQGVPKKEHGKHDWSWWSSPDRDRAAALIALAKLRPSSKLVPVLARKLVRGIDKYNTQSSAWSLLGLAAHVGTSAPNGGVDVKVKVEGRLFDASKSLGGKNKEVAIPLADLRGKKVTLVLEGDAETACAFAMDARYARPADKSTVVAKRAEFGPSVHRVYTNVAGAPIDLAKVKPGDVVRVALRIELAPLDDWRAVHLAVTDRFPAGFDPIQPDLATVASAGEIQKVHPFYEGLTSWGGEASHVDVRTDRVNVYFDRYYAKTLYATYLLRATTPGDFMLPAARAELMYEPESVGFSDAGHVTIR